MKPTETFLSPIRANHRAQVEPHGTKHCQTWSLQGKPPRADVASVQRRARTSWVQHKREAKAGVVSQAGDSITGLQGPS